MEDQSSTIVVNKLEEEVDMVDLPPGFRFHPTDEEIITHYLTPKVVNPGFVATAIGEVDLNKCEPWDLPKRAKMGEKEWYFFCQRDRKYPTGARTNRATESGYWKATGKDKEIFNKLGKGKGKGKGSCLVGMKKTLVFYRGRAPKGEKTNWVMHEFRLHGKFSYYKVSKDDWVVSRVFHKSSGIIKKVMNPGSDQSGLSRIMIDNFLTTSPPPLADPTRPSSSFCIDHRSGFDEEEEDDHGEYNYYPSLDHYQPLLYNNCNNIMNQFSSCSNPVFPMVRQNCKVEQFSSNHGSTRSQDTGLSTDMNNNTAEISSSKFETCDNNNIGMSGELIPDVADIDCLWDF